MGAGNLEVLSHFCGHIPKRSIPEIGEDAVRLPIVIGGKLLDVVIRVRVRAHQVFPAVIIQIGHSGAPTSSRGGEDGKAAWVRGILKHAAAQVVKQQEGLVVQVGNKNVGKPIVVVIAEVRPHTGDRHAGVRQRDSRLERHFLKGAVAAVVKEKVRLVVVGHEDVHEAVVVVVRKGDAHAAPLILADSGFLRDILERPVAPVAVERIAEAFEVHRVAIDAEVTGRVAAETVIVNRPVGVVHHEEVEQAVIVVIEPASRHRPLAALDPGLFRDVLETAISQIVVENVPVDARHKQVHMPVVVVIAGRGAHRVPFAGHSGLFGDVPESHPAFVSEEAIPILGGFLLQ